MIGFLSLSLVHHKSLQITTCFLCKEMCEFTCRQWKPWRAQRPPTVTSWTLMELTEINPAKILDWLLVVNMVSNMITTWSKYHYRHYVELQEDGITRGVNQTELLEQQLYTVCTNMQRGCDRPAWTTRSCKPAWQLMTHQGHQRSPSVSSTFSTITIIILVILQIQMLNPDFCGGFGFPSI